MNILDFESLGLVELEETQPSKDPDENIILIDTTWYKIKKDHTPEELYRYAVVKRLNTIKNIALIFFIVWLVSFIIELLSMLL